MSQFNLIIPFNTDDTHCCRGTSWSSATWRSKTSTAMIAAKKQLYVHCSKLQGVYVRFLHDISQRGKKMWPTPESQKKTMHLWQPVFLKLSNTIFFKISLRSCDSLSWWHCSPILHVPQTKRKSYKSPLWICQPITCTHASPAALPLIITPPPPQYIHVKHARAFSWAVWFNGQF